MAATTTRDQQRAQTRERLYEAAIAEIVERGFAAMRIDRVVQSAGVARGTFYFHFPTKDHVLYELTDRMEAQVAEGLELPDDATLGEVLERVFAVMRGPRGGMEEELQREMLAAQLRRPDRDTVPPLLEKLAAAIGRAQSRGEARADLDPEQVGLSLLTSIFGAIALLRYEPDPDQPLAVLADIFLRGVLTPEATRAQKSERSDPRAA
jgi:AcrR family transcriptional regulator